MKKNLLLYIIPLILLFNAASAKLPDVDPEWVKLTGAHDMPYKKTIYKVSAYGAVNDGTTLNTKAIQKAIDACSSKGGGLVMFDAGKYLTGALFLKENVRLEIGLGVEILGSQHIEDYPEIDTRVAGIEMKWPAALINVINKGTVAIMGQGIINAQAKPFLDKYVALRKEYEVKRLGWAADYDAPRPYTILISESTNVTVRGITLQQTGSCAVEVLYTKFSTIDGITVRNNVVDMPGTTADGVNIDSSSYMLVQNCDVDCNGKDFSIQSGREADGLRVNRAAEYVFIRNSVGRGNSGLLAVGRETSGSIRHVLASNLTGIATSNGISIKSTKTMGGTVEDIHIQNITLNGVGTAIAINTVDKNYNAPALPDGYNGKISASWKKLLNKVEPALATPHFQDIYLSNIITTNAKTAIDAEGSKETVLKDFRLNNITISAATAGNISFANNWTVDKVNITTQDGSKVSIKDSERVSL